MVELDLITRVSCIQHDCNIYMVSPRAYPHAPNTLRPRTPLKINTKTSLAGRCLIKLDILAQFGQRLSQLGGSIPATLCLIDLQC